MKTYRLPLYRVLLYLWLFIPLAGNAQQLHLSLRDIHASPAFYGAFFEGGRWAAEGPVVTYIEPENQVTHLMSYNLETDTRTRLIDGSKLQAPDVNRVIQIEDYTLTSDGKLALLFTDTERVWRLNTKGYYYIYDMTSGKLTPISDRKRGFQMFAKLSPDGKKVAFVRDRNIFLVDLATGAEKQLTSDGSENAIINGTTDWVYEEEFGLRDAWQWSPDGRFLAFLQLDESKTPLFSMVDNRGKYPQVTSFKYPKVGEANSEIRAGVIDVASGQIHFFETGTWNAGGDSLEYIPQFGWTPSIDGAYNVWLFRMNRDQNDLDLMYGNPATGAIRTVLEEKSKSWIDVETGFNDLDVGTLTYLRDGKHFVWISDRDGWRHLYLYQNDGKLVRRITQGDWNVTDFHGVDEKTGTVYFNATLESPIERHLYRTTLGSGNAAPGKPTKISSQAGWHDVNMSRDLRYYIDNYSNITTPNVWTLRRSEGTQLKVLEGNEALIALLKKYDLPTPEFMQVPGADGTPLNAMIIKPTKLDPNKKYPMLFSIYGGPGSQEVRNAWAGPGMIWNMYLAQEQGIVVATVDNRGTGGRSKEFLSAVYKRLGQLEAQDQVAAAKHFGRLSYIDPARIGIWGWSFGGYATLMSMLTGDGPKTFKVGVAVAPVTDWRLYDTIYTERYMSTPQKNATGYEQAAPTHYADRLADNQKLLIVHGDYDDNVHFQNSVQMVAALQNANKQFSFMMYPGKNHGIYGGLVRLQLYTMITDFVKNNL